jgi:hypothetical protein
VLVFYNFANFAPIVCLDRPFDRRAAFATYAAAIAQKFFAHRVQNFGLFGWTKLADT